MITHVDDCTVLCLSFVDDHTSQTAQLKQNIAKFFDFKEKNSIQQVNLLKMIVHYNNHDSYIKLTVSHKTQHIVEKYKL